MRPISIRTLAYLLATLSTAIALHSQPAPQILSEGWTFHTGDLTTPTDSIEQSSFLGVPVRVPHDWAIAGPFDPTAHGSTGKLPWQGIGWYRTDLEIPATAKGKRIYLDFDGAMAFPTVYLNGKEVGSWDYGYTPFRIDLTQSAKPGKNNVLAVRLDTNKWSSRWYPGAGLYRKVTLSFENQIHIANWGLGVKTDGDERLEIPPQTATLSLEIENHKPADSSIKIQATLLDPDGIAVASKEISTTAIAGANTHREITLHAPNPKRWDIDSPNRYTARVRILSTNGALLDEQSTRFGFRTFAFTHDDGFHLNGRRVQLKGVNLHSDLGPLGMAFNRYAQKRQLEIMIEMGVNAIRTSHNPPAQELLELCDELGLVVWDEVFDKWAWTAGRDDHTPALEPFAYRHIRNTLLRDRNHPSVIVWSIGNEVNGGDEQEGITPERTALMTGLARSIDATRPIAMACHIPSLANGKNFATLDLAGWNYSRRYKRYHSIWPEKPIVYSESASAVSTRGYYDPELSTRPSDYGPAYQISSYDLNAAFWSDVADREFEYMKTDSFVAGEFVWTGFDYIGEPTPHDVASRSSYFGIVDLCGFVKDRFFFYRSHWRDDVDTVHILPHWNWPGREGKNVPVFVYTNGDSAELFLNGKSLGTRKKGMRPLRGQNLALASTASASSGKNASLAIDQSLDTAWIADPSDTTPSWTIDLGESSHIRHLQLDTVKKEHLFAYRIEASQNEKKWEPIANKPTQALKTWQGTQRILHPVDINARYLRIIFTETTSNARPGLKDFSVYSEPITNDYYDVTYDYRLRWDTVSYQPGTLKAVAYKNGKAIGETTVETTSEAVSIRLTPERREVSADGEDLIYITAEALDAQGRACPLADNEITFSVTGAASFQATGNGDQRSFVSFSSPTRKLFYGKAQLIARPVSGKGGEITITATAKGLRSATATVLAKP